VVRRERFGRRGCSARLSRVGRRLPVGFAQFALSQEFCSSGRRPHNKVRSRISHLLLTAMTHLSCPASIVNAPVGTVWALLMRPEAWGDFYDIRISSVEPSGAARVGQTVLAESGPRLLHLKLEFRLTKVDTENYELGFDVRMPFGTTVREDIICHSLGPEHCRVNYNCNFAFPSGWRGAVLKFLLRRELDSGPADSLSRLRRAAERSYGNGDPAQRTG
jgi:hypothetical protein